MASFLTSWLRKRGPAAGSGTKEMSFLDHLEDLRGHLFRSAVFVVLAGIVLFIYRQEVIGNLFLWPFHGDFPTYQVLCGFMDDFCFDKIDVSLQAISPYEQFMKSMSYAFFGALILTFPYLAWELWRFIRPGLKPKEIKVVRWNVVWVSLLFFTGVVFCYFIILPFSIQFLSSFTLFEGVRNDWRIGDVVTMELLFMAGTGGLFQLPLLVYYLTKLGILSTEFLKKYRRHAIVVLLIIAAVITPPDPLSQILVFLPLMLLYEIGIWVAKGVERNKAKDNVVIKTPDSP